MRRQFLASRYRRRSATPRKRLSELRFEENRELLEPLLAVMASLGRLPDAEEFPQAAAVSARFGALQRAFALVQRVTGPEAWDAIRRCRTEDLLVYLALSRFR
jgi:DNA phosphorothioation-associated putative methyltransferase